jgi:hypothetical protein
MSNHTGFYLTSARLAKYAGVDRRTVDHRLTAAGYEPDAHLCDAAGDLALWKRERLSELLGVIERSGATPIPLSVLLNLSK